jgi:beta-lactamase class A
VEAAPTASDSAAPDPTATVAAALAAALAAQGSHVGIEVLDLVTGAAVGYQASVGFHTASVVKVDILATLLWQEQQAGRRLTDDQRDLAQAMITESDNDAASALWDAIGGDTGLARANVVFGLTQTTPGAGGYWGSTTTTAADQVRLLAMLTDESGPLAAEGRAYELGLMASVESDQRWGVPAASGSAATAVYVKDGWLSSPSDDDLWIVNSIGRIVEPGHDWLVAVLSDHHEDEDPGIALVQQAATIAVGGLR